MQTKARTCMLWQTACSSRQETFMIHSFRAIMKGALREHVRAVQEGYNRGNGTGTYTYSCGSFVTDYHEM
jgi:hypothetical protein